MSELGVVRERAPWSPVQRGAFRFGVVYLVLMTFPFPLNALPKMEWLEDGYYRISYAVAVWVGHNVLGITRDIPTRMNGSGDKTVDYLVVLCWVAIAAIAAIAWSVADRRRAEHRRLAATTRVGVRYYLAFIMLLYGVVKVLPLQFPAPHPARLIEAYGDSSPMGLLWTFIGYSPAYGAFTGLAEVSGGLLLLWRRTTTLGSLVLLGVLTNVVMLNFCYDVPVKLFSLHLLALTMVLLAPDVRRLAAVLVHNRAVPAAEIGGPRPRRLRAVKWAFIALMIGGTSYVTIDRYYESGPGAELPSFYGAYQVESPPSTPWRRIAVGHGRFAVVDSDARTHAYRLRRDPADPGLFVITPYEASADEDPPRYTLRLTAVADGKVRIAGDTDVGAVDVAMRRIDTGDMELTSRGFRWINEYPHNR